MGAARRALSVVGPDVAVGDVPAGRPAEAGLSSTLDRVAADAPGLIAASFVDLASGTTLVSRCQRSGFDISVAGALASAIVRHRLRVIRAFNREAGIDDMLVRIDGQLHLVRLLTPTLVLYVIGDAATTHFAALREIAARHAGSAT
jgi:hypothetical protein